MRNTFFVSVMLSVAAFAVCAQAPATKPATGATPVHHAASGPPTAIIETTAGKLTCTLFPDKAPIGVANFIGLATGTKDWKNPVTGVTKHGVPLYDGTIFHRVIAGFMIQGGDPKGDGTGEIGINSSYYPIYYLPVVTAALYCGPLLTFFWTLLASAAYCSYLYPALQEYDLTPDAFGQLALRVMFFFLAAMVVNRFSQQSQHQTQLYRELAERLAETNRRLEQAQDEARRSERLAALGQLSAGLAHEIRNPLGVIKGSAEMLTQKLQASDSLAREFRSPGNGLRSCQPDKSIRSYTTGR